MPTLTTRKPKAKSAPRRAPAKSAEKRQKNRGPSFGEWARRVAGMMKNGPSDLSMREGFGK